MFIDKARIFIKSGNGGNGVVHFRREKYVPNGGPDGGDGGKGGDVVFIASKNFRTLADFKYKRKYIAEDGNKGEGNRKTGRDSEDLIIMVPCGTIIRNKDTGILVADLVNDGDKVIAARGGKGGKGNQHFATPTRQVPNFARDGADGQELWVDLELKLLADVGLVGFPNVGKSTILSVVSAAKPKIANYHFTTLTPNLGVVELGDGQGFVVADIPGIIEGASEGVGLGHEFLRHIERTRMLVHVLDAAELDGRDAYDDLFKINDELKQYSDKLAERPMIVALNKTDVVFDQDRLQTIKSKLETDGYDVFEISAVTNKGLEQLIRRIQQMLKEIPEVLLFDEKDEEVIYRAEEEIPYTVEVVNSEYIVEGEAIRRLLGRVNIDDEESLRYFQISLRKLGVIDSLENKGIEEEDTVRMYDFSFDYYK